MQQLDVASLKEQGTVLQIVFVPPETTFFNDIQRSRLRDILIQGLQSHNLIGELVAVWEHEGETHFMGNPHWVEFIQGNGFARLHAQSNNHIVVN